MKRCLVFAVEILASVVFVVGVADAQSSVQTQTSCYVQGGVRTDSQSYDPATKTAEVVISVIPDPTVQTSWGCFDRKDGRLRVDGHGFVPASVSNPAHAEMLAKQAAHVTALGNLAECVCGVKVKTDK